MTSGIYCITNKINGHRYIGSTTNLRKRRANNFSKLRRGVNDCLHLQRAWNLYGEDAFEFRHILICEKDELLRYEQELLDRWKPEYNIRRKAEANWGIRLSEEACHKISERMKGNKYGLGFKHSKETKKRIASKHRGRKFSQQHCANISHAKQGSKLGPRPQGVRERIAASNRGQKRTEQQRRNISAAKSGIHIGEGNPNAKLSEQAVIFVRYLFRKGLTQTRLASICGLSQTSIGRLVQGKAWSHVRYGL